MSVVVFAGPTLDTAAGKRVLDAVFLPPAGQGDVYRAARQRPRAICIIDGTFERAPAIWHKEILWALSRGVHVFGASSMGALRAAELWPFGMVGVGTIFEWFRDGVLEDDDEVAVSHAGPEHGHRATSEALVNIRATLKAAVSAGALTQDDAARLLELAKREYYPDRAYPSLLQAARAAGMPEGTLATLRNFLERGQINQKRLDAFAALDHVASRLDAIADPFVPTFHFEHTETWDQVEHAAGPADAQAGEEAGAVVAWTEELRWQRLYQLANRGALLRAQANAKHTRFTATDVQRSLTEEAFRRERGLEGSEDMQRWLRQNELSPFAFARVMQEEASYRRFRALHADDAAHHLRTELIASGYFAPIKQRADEKRAALAARGLESPELADAGLSMEELEHWFVEVRFGQPRRVLPRLLLELGFPDQATFCREALREYLFLKFKNGVATADD